MPRFLTDTSSRTPRTNVYLVHVRHYIDGLEGSDNIIHVASTEQLALAYLRKHPPDTVWRGVWCWVVFEEQVDAETLGEYRPRLVGMFDPAGNPISDMRVYLKSRETVTAEVAP